MFSDNILLRKCDRDILRADLSWFCYIIGRIIRKFSGTVLKIYKSESGIGTSCCSQGSSTIITCEIRHHDVLVDLDESIRKSKDKERVLKSPIIQCSCEVNNLNTNKWTYLRNLSKNIYILTYKHFTLSLYWIAAFMRAVCYNNHLPWYVTEAT